MSRTKKSLFSAILLCLSLITPLEAMTRAETLHRILTALNLPIGRGRSFADVAPNHPYSRSIASACAMGILFPSDMFYPDIPASKAEALAFAFRAMGWKHEAGIVAKHEGQFQSIPSYLQPYVILGTATNPRAPSQITDFPEGEFTREDSRALGLWLRRCMMQGIRWDHRESKGDLTLLVHREGVGRPPARWLPSSAVADKLDRLGFGAQENQSLFWAAIKAPAGRASVKTAPSIGAKTLTLSQIARYSDAFAAINAGFFGDDRPIGTLVIRGIPASAPYRDRSAVGWNGWGEVFFGSGSYRPTAVTELGQVPIAEINRPVQEGQIGLYTPHFGQIASRISGAGTEILIKDGTILGFRDSESSHHMMGEDGIILWARTSGLGFLADSRRLSVNLEWRDGAMGRATNVIQAGPMLSPGRGVANREDFSDSFMNLRHPRTMAGWDGRHLWWIAVDGRSSWHSAGLTIDEAASLAGKLGLSQALNLDGGGSTQLWWNGKTINRISDGKERPLPYAVVFR